MLKGNATESINLDGVNCMIISANDGKFHPCSGGTLAAGKAYLDVDPSELGANAKLSIEEIDASSHRHQRGEGPDEHRRHL